VRVTGQNINAIAGTSFTGPVASVIGAEKASDLTATINWGDGSPHSSGTVSGTDPYTITGTHTYTTAGSYTVTIKVADSNLNSTSIGKATATVTNR
jgi:PKD repeat protein